MLPHDDEYVAVYAWCKHRNKLIRTICQQSTSTAGECEKDERIWHE